MVGLWKRNVCSNVWFNWWEFIVHSSLSWQTVRTWQCTSSNLRESLRGSSCICVCILRLFHHDHIQVYIHPRSLITWGSARSHFSHSSQLSTEASPSFKYETYFFQYKKFCFSFKHHLGHGSFWFCVFVLKCMLFSVLVLLSWVFFLFLM